MYFKCTLNEINNEINNEYALDKTMYNGWQKLIFYRGLYVCNYLNKIRKPRFCNFYYENPSWVEDFYKVKTQAIFEEIFF